MLRDHVLLPWARSLAADPGRWSAELRKVGDAAIEAATAELPADWLGDGPARAAYAAFLAARRDRAAAYLQVPP
jgi:hypothetical protein